MPFKSCAQQKAMFAKGGKSAKTAHEWANKYGSACAQKGKGSGSKSPSRKK